MWKYRHAGFPSIAYRGIWSHKARRDWFPVTQHLGYWALVDLGLCNLTKKEKEKKKRARERENLICSNWSTVEGRKHPSVPGEGAELKSAGVWLRDHVV